jgi:hypothetical protein
MHCSYFLKYTAAFCIFSNPKPSNLIMKKSAFLLLIICSVSLSYSQVAINNSGALPDGSAMLDVSSTTKGFLAPRMTSSQRDGIFSPETGLMVYDETTDGFWFFNGSEWVQVSKHNFWSPAVSSPDNKIILSDINDFVGIGTSNPTYKLTVNGTVFATNYYGDGSSLSGTGDDLGNHTASGNIHMNNHWLSGDGSNEGIYVTSLGRVGIGTNNPSTHFEVWGNGNFNAPDAGSVALRLRENFEHRWTFLFRDWVGGTLSILDEVGNKNTMVFEPVTGHVGLGITDPEAPLHITGGTDLSLSGGGYLLAGSSGSLNLILDENEIQARNNGSAGSLYINHDGGDVVITTTQSGNVGIGKVGPTEKLDVEGNLHVSGNIELDGTVNVPTTTRYYTVPGNSFNLETTTTQEIFRGESSVWAIDSYEDFTFYAPVQLPDGAVVTEVLAQIWDANSVWDITVELRRFSTNATSNAATNLMASVSSTGSIYASFRTFNTTSISNATINTQNYSYILKAEWYNDLGDDQMRLGNVRIKYTIDELQ